VDIGIGLRRLVKEAKSYLPVELKIGLIKKGNE